MKEKKYTPHDYVFKFLHKETGAKGKIGRAWKNPDGTISIVLDPKVVLPQNPDEILRLFRVDKGQKSKEESGTSLPEFLAKAREQTPPPF